MSNKSSDNNGSVSNRPTNNRNTASNSNNATTKKEEVNADNKEDNNSSSSRNTSSQGTYGSSADAKKYANEEISRLAKENKKHYSYTVDRNNKGEFVVNIKEG